MPLTINLKPRERLIVNGVVIENSGQAAKILIHNTAALLREKDILTEEQANTPARRIYFAIQCQYLFPGKEHLFLPIIYDFLREFAAAAPSTASLVRDIRRFVDGGDFYRALRSARAAHRKRAGDLEWRYPRRRIRGCLSRVIRRGPRRGRCSRPRASSIKRARRRSTSCAARCGATGACGPSSRRACSIPNARSRLRPAANLLGLANFIDRQTAELLAKPDPAKIDVLVSINRQISEGLLDGQRAGRRASRRRPRPRRLARSV